MFVRVQSYAVANNLDSDWSARTDKWLVGSDCGNEKYLHHDSTDPFQWKCEECPDGASCIGEAAPVALAGWWRVAWKKNEFRTCLRPDSCLANEVCAQFHTGTLCASCETDAYRDSATYECNECGPGSASRVALFFLVLAGSAVIAGIVRVTLADGGAESAIDIKIA